MQDQQEQKIEEARVAREKHEEMLRVARMKNEEDAKKRKEVRPLFIIFNQLIVTNNLCS